MLLGQLHQTLPASEGHGHTGRILEIRNHINSLDPFSGLGDSLQLFGHEVSVNAFLVNRYPYRLTGLH